MLLAAATILGLGLGLVFVGIGSDPDHIPIAFSAAVASFALVLVIGGVMETSAKTADRVGWGYLLTLAITSAAFGALRLYGGGDAAAFGSLQLGYGIVFGALATRQFVRTFQEGSHSIRSAGLRS